MLWPFSSLQQNAMVKRASTLGEESSQAYRFGGYAPITIGQILNGGRYKVACKLGFGE